MRLLISFIATSILSISTFAASNQIDAQIMAEQLQQQTMVEAAAGGGLNFHVGDTVAHDLNIGGFIQGKMDQSVREETNEGFWIVQDIDLMIQKQKVETLIDKRDGHVIKMLVDGKEQQPPSSDDIEVIGMEQTQVTVPQRPQAYDAILVKVKNKKDGKITQMWVNPKEVPLNGMLKMIAPTPLGDLTAVLVSFARGH